MGRGTPMPARGEGWGWAELALRLPDRDAVDIVAAFLTEEAAPAIVMAGAVSARGGPATVLLLIEPPGVLPVLPLATGDEDERTPDRLAVRLARSLRLYVLAPGGLLDPDGDPVHDDQAAAAVEQHLEHPDDLLLAKTVVAAAAADRSVLATARLVVRRLRLTVRAMTATAPSGRPVHLLAVADTPAGAPEGLAAAARSTVFVRAATGRWLSVWTGRRLLVHAWDEHDVVVDPSPVEWQLADSTPVATALHELGRAEADAAPFIRALRLAGERAEAFRALLREPTSDERTFARVAAILDLPDAAAESAERDGLTEADGDDLAPLGLPELIPALYAEDVGRNRLGKRWLAWASGHPRAHAVLAALALLGCAALALAILLEGSGSLLQVLGAYAGVAGGVLWITIDLAAARSIRPDMRARDLARRARA